MTSESLTADKHLSEKSERIIGSATSAEEIIEELAKRGCPDLTALVKADTCSQYPVAAGGFCDVYRGRLKDNTEIAIKSLRAYEDGYGDQKKKKILKHAARELYCWSKLRHPNILPLMGLAIFQSRISLISHWIASGNLNTYLRRHPAANRLPLCMDVCSAVRHIHASNMVHGDIKGANIMVSPSGVAMLTDFGSTTIRDITLQFTNTGNPGFSVCWAAPELLENSVTTRETDVYAFGKTALEAMTGELPFDGEEKKALNDAFKGGKPLLKPANIATELWCILSPCWSRKPGDRPTMGTIESQLSSYESTIAERHTESRQLTENTIKIFKKHGYIDVTRSLIATKSPTAPDYPGESRDIYLGALGDGGKVAINLILKGNNDSIESALEKQFRVLKSWLGCNHPNLSQIRGFAEFLGQPAILFSWADYRSVGAYLRSKPSANRCAINASICDAVAYLHANEIVYTDLRGDTILMVGEDVPMLAEPGADILESTTTSKSDKSSKSISARWTAPEVLQGHDHTYASDVYALGMTILEITTGVVPFPAVNDGDIYSTVVEKKQIPQRPEAKISESSAQGPILWANLRACWSRVVTRRPSADELTRMMKTMRLEGLVPDTDEAMDRDDNAH